MPDAEPRLTAADAEYILEALDAAGIDVWIAGGWGVDALVGSETRPHRDLDIIIPMDRVLRTLEVLHAEGFKVAEDWFPVRFEMVDDRHRVIDVHPVRFDDTGNAYLEMIDDDPWVTPAHGLTGTGIIGTRAVKCHTAEEQMRDHAGYEPAEKDRHDVALLSEHFGLALPPGYPH